MKRKWLKLLITFILLIIFTFIILVFLSNKVMPFYMNYSEAEMKRVVTTVINKSVTEEVTNQLEVDSLFVLKKENDNTIIVDFDPVIVNRVMSKISDVVYNNLKLISKKDKLTLEKYNLDESYFYIPGGIIFNTTMLNNVGRRIPINLEIISSVNPNLKTEVTEYGINNSLIEVYINVIVDVKMILPMYANTMQIVVVVPLAVKLIQGEVPKYYQRGYASSTLFFDEKSTFLSIFKFIKPLDIECKYISSLDSFATSKSIVIALFFSTVFILIKGILAFKYLLARDNASL